jgi:uncharacterized protein
MTMIGPKYIEKAPTPNVDYEDFDVKSGSRAENIIFNNRRWIVLLCTLITCFLGYNATRIHVNANFTNMLPQDQSYVRNFAENSNDLRGLGDSVRIVVQNNEGTIFDPKYLETLKNINDSVFLLPGVDRSFMKSLWTPGVRWTEITEQGFVGGPVMPDGYDGTDASLAQLRENISNAGIVGSIVANDQRSSSIFVPILEQDAATGKPINYGEFWNKLQEILRANTNPSVSVHVVGFAAIMGTLIADIYEVAGFFAIAVVVSFCFIFLFTRCIRSAATILSCSLIAVVWLLGLLCLFSYDLDPYSVLVPFLIFAIGVSHGTQKMNGIMQDIGRGADRYVAARITFRRLFLAGFTALIADAVGFLVLSVIDIQSIRALAFAASVGVTVLIFTNLVLLPVLLSFIGVSRYAALRSIQVNAQTGRFRLTDKIFGVLERFTGRRWAISAIIGAAILAVVGSQVGRGVAIGDVSPGAPEFRVNSVYNHDNAYVMQHYNLSSDEFAVIVKTPSEGLDNFQSMVEMDKLSQFLRQVPGVQTTVSAADFVRIYTAESFGGNLEWWTISRDPLILGEALNDVFVNNPELINNDYSVAPVIAYLADHKAKTLAAVARAAQEFADTNSGPNEQFILAAGNGGMDEATNIVVRRANFWMPFLIYGAVILLCFISFRTWRAVLVAVIPLVITTLLCQALMVLLGIGIKVATLPVTALGVGIGVDYALYLLYVQLAFQRGGDPLPLAYHKALRFTGKIVGLVGLTLAAAVSLWAFSPIRFQADMGILLTFMFLWNMVGALILVPALSHFLLPSEKIYRAPI